MFSPFKQQYFVSTSKEPALVQHMWCWTKHSPQKWIYALYTCMMKLQDENRTNAKDLDKEVLK